MKKIKKFKIKQNSNNEYSNYHYFIPKSKHIKFADARTLDTEIGDLRNQINELEEKTKYLIDKAPLIGFEEGESSLNLRGCANDEIRKVGIDGQSEQKQYSGKNWFNINSVTTSNQTNWTVNISNNTLSIIHNNDFTTGTPKSEKIYFKVGTYVISYNGNIKFGINKNGSYLEMATKEYILNITSQEDYYEFSFPATGTWENIMIRPNNTDDTYEPYVGGQPSPNPEYPQDIEVIDGVNLLNKNSYETTDTIRQDDFVWDNDLPIGTYNISFDLDSFTLGSNSNISIYFDAENILAINSSNTLKRYNYTFTTTTIKKKGSTSNFRISAINYNNGARVKISNIQITKGTTPKPYLPHGHIGLRQSGEQLLDTKLTFTYESGSASSGINFIQNNDGSISINGTAKETVVIDFKLPNYIPIGTTINLSISEAVTNLQQSLRNSSHNILSETYFNGKSDKTATLTDSAYYYRIQINKDSVMNTTIKPMLIKGTIPAPFELYHSPKVYPINLNGNSIAKVGDVKDLLKIYRNGDVEIKKNIGKVVFNGSETWYLYKNIDSSYCYFTTIKDCKIGVKNSICSHFKNVSSSWDAGIVGQFSDHGSSTNKYFTTNIASIADWKTYLLEQKNSGTPVTVKYQLATPKTIKLPSIEPITLWEGTNNFKLITNLDTTFKTIYKKDINALIADSGV